MSRAGTEIVILLGGEPVDPAHGLALPRGAVVVAADSGIDQAHRLGLAVDVAVGDFDSVSHDGLERARREGAEIQAHPVAKDRTDFELALESALRLGAESAVVVGGEGGRLDHSIANALVMASPRYASIELSAIGRGGARLHVVRSERQLTGLPGEVVTLLAVGGPALGVSTDGLRYELHEAVLEPGSSLGVSNELVGAAARVALTGGVLLAVLPGPGHRTGTTSRLEER